MSAISLYRSLTYWFTPLPAELDVTVGDSGAPDTGTGLARLSGRLFCWAIIPVISCCLYLGLVLGGIRGGIEDGKGGINGAPPIPLVMGL